MPHMELFAGTAGYYDKYRSGIPDEARDFVLDHVENRQRLLDLGAGTGRVLAQFAPYFRDTIAVEPDHDMARLARARLRSFAVQLFESSAETFIMPLG